MKDLDIIKDFLSNIDGDYRDICAQYYFLFIKNEENNDFASEKLSYLLKWNYDSNKKNKQEELYSEEEYNKAINKSSPIIEKIVENMIDSEVEEVDFYRVVWKAVSEEVFFPLDIDRIGAIISLFFSPKIPYFKLEKGLQMEEEEFQEKSRDLIRQIQKALYIFNCGYEQKTEVSSQIMKIILELNSFEEKTVFLANVIGFLEANSLGNISKG